MPQAQVIADQIRTLNTVYQRRMDEAAMATVAAVWMNDLGGLDNDTFCRALELHRKHSPYWPTPAHILAAAEVLTPNRPPMVALPEHTPTDEDWRNYQANAEKYCKRFKLEGLRVTQ